MGLLQQNKHAEKKTGNDQALEAEFQLLMTVSNQKICKSLPFFYFLTFEKGRLLYIHPVGWSVDVTINFFQYIQA